MSCLDPGKVDFCKDSYCVGDVGCLRLSAGHSAETGGYEGVSCKVSVLGDTQFLTSCVQDGVECAVNDALGSDVHPAACCHLSVVCNAHFLCDLPVLQVVIHADHHCVGDDDTGSIGLGGEQSQRMSGLHYQRQVVSKLLKILLDESVLEPVLAY